MILLLLSACLLGAVSSQLLGLQEGEECRALGGGQGICTSIVQCKTAGDFKNNQPPICSFNKKDPVICCPNLLGTKSKPGHKAEQYCKGLLPLCHGSQTRRRGTSEISDFTRKLEPSTKPPSVHFVVGGHYVEPRTHTHMWIFGNLVYLDCAGLISGNTCKPGPPIIRKRATAVVGGTFSKQKTTPFMALIGYGKENQISWGCGGSLITARYVLSAAHCVNPSQSLGMARWARLGDLDISSDKEDAKPINKRIVERITYPEYVDTQVYHDIAIFKLDSDVVFNQWVMPICLQTQINTNLRATVVGWGRTDFAEGTSDQLLEADLDVYNDTECQRLMFSSTNNKTPRGYQRNLMFCAGVPDGKKDACLGDSGGPLVFRKTGQCIKTQIGITSYGNQCGLENSPGVYTRVSNYVSWIEGIVFGDDIAI